MRHFPLPAWSVLALLLLNAPALPAEDSPPKPAALDVTQLADQLQALRGEIVDRVQALRVVVEEEHAAKRISEQAAHSLLWTLNTSGLSAGFNGDLRASSIPVENEKLITASHEFERANTATELTAADALAQPPEVAIERVCDALAKSGDWRRLYDLLNARARLHGGRGGPDEAVGALRAFFEGQNFELAELWPDAAQAYKTVLRSTSPRAPIQAAADRLKAITAAHPDAAAIPSAPPARFIPR